MDMECVWLQIVMWCPCTSASMQLRYHISFTFEQCHRKLIGECDKIPLSFKNGRYNWKCAMNDEWWCRTCQLPLCYNRWFWMDDGNSVFNFVIGKYFRQIIESCTSTCEFWEVFFSKERCIGKRSNLYQGTFNQNPNCGWFQSKLWGKSHIFILFFAIFRFTSNPVETAPKATSSIHMTSSQSLLINIETWTSVNLSIATELLLSQENSVFFTHFQVI